MRVGLNNSLVRRTRVPACARAFSLLELLAALVIIGIVAAIAIPRLSGLRGGNVMAVANRQLQDDLAFARQKAISERTTVFVVFVPTNFWASAGAPTANKQFNNLVTGQLTDYALYASRSVGDQPGRPIGRYLTEWKSLPEGIYIPPWKYGVTNTVQVGTNLITIAPFLTNSSIPFPNETNTAFTPDLPVLAFDAQGRLTSGVDEFIPLARGSILDPVKDPTGYYPYQAADVVETPPGNSTSNPNLIHINWLTGRSRTQRPELQ